MEPILAFLFANVWFLIIAIGLSSTLGDSLINIYSKTDDLKWFVAGIGGWTIAAWFFALLLKKFPFAPGISLFFLGNITVGILIGKFYFKDQVTLHQWTGMVIGILAMVLMTKGGE